MTSKALQRITKHYKCIIVVSTLIISPISFGINCEDTYNYTAGTCGPRLSFPTTGYYGWCNWDSCIQACNFFHNNIGSKPTTGQCQTPSHSQPPSGHSSGHNSCSNDISQMQSQLSTYGSLTRPGCTISTVKSPESLSGNTCSASCRGGNNVPGSGGIIQNNVSGTCTWKLGDWGNTLSCP